MVTVARRTMIGGGIGSFMDGSAKTSTNSPLRRNSGSPWHITPFRTSHSSNDGIGLKYILLNLCKKNAQCSKCWMALGTPAHWQDQKMVLPHEWHQRSCGLLGRMPTFFFPGTTAQNLFLKASKSNYGKQFVLLENRNGWFSLVFSGQYPLWTSFGPFCLHFCEVPPSLDSWKWSFEQTILWQTSESGNSTIS